MEMRHRPAKSAALLRPTTPVLVLYHDGNEANATQSSSLAEPPHRTIDCTAIAFLIVLNTVQEWDKTMKLRGESNATRHEPTRMARNPPWSYLTRQRILVTQEPLRDPAPAAMTLEHLVTLVWPAVLLAWQAITSNRHDEGKRCANVVDLASNNEFCKAEIRRLQWENIALRNLRIFDVFLVVSSSSSVAVHKGKRFARLVLIDLGKLD